MDSVQQNWLDAFCLVSSELHHPDPADLRAPIRNEGLEIRRFLLFDTLFSLRPKLVAVEDVVVSSVPFGRSFSIDSVVTQPDESGIPYAKLNFMEVLENNRGTTGAMHKCVVTV